MKAVIFILVSTVTIFNGYTQAQFASFIKNGQVLYERKVNTYGALEKIFIETKRYSEDDLPEEMRKFRNSSPQFWADSFYLYFDHSATLYQPANPDILFSTTFPILAAYKNKVFTDFSKGNVITEKTVLDKIYFIQDSLKPFVWKLTEETREIAGYHCRRANGLMFDSVYVVAFYTDEIPIRGGPESFNGLPGLILGLALPDQHISIFAKSVVGIKSSLSNWNLPTIGKNTPISNQQFKSITSNNLKDLIQGSSWMLFFINL